MDASKTHSTVQTSCPVISEHLCELCGQKFDSNTEVMTANAASLERCIESSLLHVSVKLV